MRFIFNLFKQPQALYVLAANLYIFYGVVVLEWPIFLVMVIFWTENIVLGFFNMLKVFSYRKSMEPGKVNAGPRPIAYRAMIGLILFAVFLAFCHVHAIFLHLLFAQGIYETWSDGLYLLQNVFEDPELLYAFAAIIGSYAFDFFHRYLYKGGRDETHVIAISQGPFLRVAVLHLVIILGGLVVSAFGSPLLALILLLIFKIIFELFSHRFIDFMVRAMKGLQALRNQQKTDQEDSSTSS